MLGTPGGRAWPPIPGKLYVIWDGAEYIQLYSDRRQREIVKLAKIPEWSIVLYVGKGKELDQFKVGFDDVFGMVYGAVFYYVSWA